MLHVCHVLLLHGWYVEIARLAAADRLWCGMAQKYPKGFTAQHHAEYVVWTNMKARCTNPRRPEYQWYGGRGITFCERWKRFDAFMADMGPRPGTEYTLERLDNEAGYEPGNCCWATYAEQAQNKRNTQPLMDRIAGGAQKWGADVYPKLERPHLETRPLEALLGAGFGSETDPVYWEAVRMDM